MSGNWQNRILNFEILPPKDVWEKIADQLDEEYQPADTMLSQKLHDYEITPPSIIFDNILENLTREEPAKPKGRIFAFPSRRVAIAAAVVGLSLVSLFYFLNSPSSSTANSTADILPVIPDKQSQGLVPRGNKNHDASQAPASKFEVASLNPDGNKKPTSAGNRNSRNNGNIKHVNLNPVLATNAAGTPISVSAPPIYDGNGNIIMDETLVSAPDDNYIIVTSPNGEQTKISRKFLKMLTVMNGGTDNYYANPENFFWKLRFEEWRSKLLQQASYIPTANNFLDIMDLKEMLQEN